MNDDFPDIVDIKSVPKSSIASLHLRYLPTAFSGRSGGKLLELYYHALSVDEQAISLAAVWNKQTVGFACAVGHASEIQRQLLTQFPFSIVGWALVQILCKPQVLVGLIRRLVPATTKMTYWHRPDDLAGWYTYRPIVVDEAYRTYRVADRLTENLLREAERRKVPGIVSFVDQSNVPSIRHFLRNGFQEIWKNEHSIVFGKKLIDTRRNPEREIIN